MTTLGFILTLVFVAAKIFDAVTFGWLIVFLPLIIGVTVDLIVLAFFALIAVER